MRFFCPRGAVVVSNSHRPLVSVFLWASWALVGKAMEDAHDSTQKMEQISDMQQHISGHVWHCKSTSEFEREIVKKKVFQIYASESLSMHFFCSLSVGTHEYYKFFTRTN
jgi:hypothetical protein